MNQKQARQEGIEAGYTAGINGDFDYQRDKEPNETFEDAFTRCAFESEENARQFSPFEFLAAEMNADEERSEGLWEAYDAGVAVGIRKALKMRRV